jgi:hypothetical protein
MLPPRHDWDVSPHRVGCGGQSRNGNYKRGLYTAEAIASRRWLRRQIREVRAQCAEHGRPQKPGRPRSHIFPPVTLLAFKRQQSDHLASLGASFRHAIFG